jgi:hypothetical protein
MIDIREIEESILIETNDFSWPIHQVYNEIMVSGKSISQEDAMRLTSMVIGSMVTEGMVTLVKATYREEDEDIYARESERSLTPEETDLILRQPDRWEEADALSLTESYELVITEAGRARLALLEA